MTTEKLIQKVREELGMLDTKGEQIVATALRVLQGSDKEHVPQRPEDDFVSRNISMEEYRALSHLERRRYQSDAEKINRRWIDKQFKSLGANWIMVIDGNVVKYGSTLDNYPGDEELRNLRQQTGKCPFVFLSKFLLTIEEHQTQWHHTNEPADSYPALSVTVLGQSNLFETEADLDTGAVECYGDLDRLVDRGVINIDPDDIEHNSSHLSQPVYLTKEVRIDLVDKLGVSHSYRTAMICVSEWQNSPFTVINPDRTLLLGRRVLLRLRPRITLDFDLRLTEVEFRETIA